MGWDTQINILAESCKDDYLEIAHLIYEKDAKYYTDNGYSKISFRIIENISVLFFTYERRKYLPYWVIQEISSVYKDVSFTIVASCPDFINGPAGIVKIISGEIIDSYGFFGIRKSIAEKPHAELILQWFGKNKREEIIRQTYLENHPQFWCEENYMDNLIEFSEGETNELENFIRTFESRLPGTGWNEITIEELKD